MKITVVGTDFVVINEQSLRDDTLLNIPKIHLIQFDFHTPTKEKVEGILTLFNKTNRFVISNNIRFYNDILKHTTKKYYVMNNVGDPFITFLRKNNKVLLNFTNLTKHEYAMATQENILSDLLRNVEVIIIKSETFYTNEHIFTNWAGNCVFVN